jgi:hypothetical protein
MPGGITDRNADLWEALLAIADAEGGDWPERGRAAAVALVALSQGDRHSLGVRLLTDLRNVFSERPALSTAEILEALKSLDEAPWGDLKDKPIDARRLATLLGPYGVKSKNVRIGHDVVKGYSAEDLHDPWQRYVPQHSDVGLLPKGGATSATSTTTDDEEAIPLFEEEG